MDGRNNDREEPKFKKLLMNLGISEAGPERAEGTECHTTNQPC
jgi:hypothetical protein